MRYVEDRRLVEALSGEEAMEAWLVAFCMHVGRPAVLMSISPGTTQDDERVLVFELMKDGATAAACMPAETGEAFLDRIIECAIPRAPQERIAQAFAVFACHLETVLVSEGLVDVVRH